MREPVRGSLLALGSLLSGFALVLAPAVVPATVDTLSPAYAADEEIYVRPADGVFQIEGHGWGHGHGLSQWGAQGAATHGVTYDKILAAYYPSTTRSASAQGNMRVLLEQDDETDLQIMPSTGLAVTDASTGTKTSLPSGAAYDRWRARVSGSNLVLEKLDGSTWSAYPINLKTSFKGPLVFSSTQQTRRLVFPDATQRDYRGTLSAVVTGSGVMESVATMGLEDYLRGVVPREASSSWHAEALKAQSVAARTYSAYKRAHASAGSPWDICDTTQCQVFGGTRLISGSSTTELEAASTNSAIDATKGQVMLYQGQPAFTEFSSSNGGWSTDGNQPYLVAKADPWDGLAFDDSTSNVHHWKATLKASDLEARYGPQGLKHFTRMRIINRDGNGDWGGRVKDIELDGTDAQGSPITVDATGGGIFLSHQWPSYSDGLRSNWWRIIPTYDAQATSLTGNRNLVAGSTSDLTVGVRNTGTVAWPASNVHLIVGDPRGGKDALVSGSTTPGTFVSNTSQPGASTVQPGQVASFRIRLNSNGIALGTYQENWQVRIGANPPFGPIIRTTVYVAKATYTAALAAAPSGAPANGSAPPAVDSKGNVIVPRNGSTRVTLKIRNTGNVTWPANGDVTLATSGPRGHASTFAGTGWLNSSRPGRLGGKDGSPGTPVAPGEVGAFTFTVYGNGRGVGVSKESFEPVWEGKHWLDGAVTTLTLIRTDPSIDNAAVLDSAAPTALHLPSYPLGKDTVKVRLRNVGGSPWVVKGGERIGTADGKDSIFSTDGWSSKSVGPQLVGNASRNGLSQVYPGEVGEWRVPLSAWKVKPGNYTQLLRAVEGTALFGPTIRTSIEVRPAAFTGSLKNVSTGTRIGRNGYSTVVLDVTNTSTVDWPVNGPVRSVAYASGGSPSKGTNWISPSRPGALAENATVKGGSVVHPGQVARFYIVLNGNGRAAGSYSETFGVGWEGWSDSGLRVKISYAIQ